MSTVPVRINARDHHALRTVSAFTHRSISDVLSDCLDRDEEALDAVNTARERYDKGGTSYTDFLKEN
jgi:hypothetical protein